jgi:hypothetical protein
MALKGFDKSIRMELIIIPQESLDKVLSGTFFEEIVHGPHT